MNILPVWVVDSYWFSEGSCNYTDPEVFFPSKEDSSDNALIICSSCPVIEQCRQYCLTEENKYHTSEGIWGGLTPSQRKLL